MFERKESYKVFISYERKDAYGWAGIVYEKLKDFYGEGIVFKDVEETRTGTDWEPRLARLLKGCEAFVLIIGPDWKETRVIDKLNDPTNWVHKELVTAVDEGKKIFPVVVEGAELPEKAKIPEKIFQAIGRQQFRLRQSSKFWVGDIERLCADMEAETAIRPRKTLLSATPCEHLICRLDRDKELGSVKERYGAGGRLFIARGSRRSGFRYFAIRCALEVVIDAQGSRATSKRKDAPLVEVLKWGHFCEPEDSQTRRATLLRDIAQNVFTGTADYGPDLENRIKSRIQKNVRPTIVYSTVMRGSAGESSRVEEWFRIWRELLAEDRSRTIGVILFMESGWWPWSGRGLQRFAQGGQPVPSLGKVHRDHLREWLGTDVQRVPDESLRQSLHHAGSRLYRFRLARHFEDISEKIHETWAQS